MKKLKQKGVVVKVFERTGPDVALSSMHCSLSPNASNPFVFTTHDCRRGLLEGSTAVFL